MEKVSANVSFRPLVCPEKEYLAGICIARPSSSEEYFTKILKTRYLIWMDSGRISDHSAFFSGISAPYVIRSVVVVLLVWYEVFNEHNSIGKENKNTNMSMSIENVKYACQLER